VVAWVFILATTAIVAATGLWPDTQPAIFVLLAFSGLFVLIVHDLLPEDTLGPAKFVVEGSVAITVATLLVALTGGQTEPVLLRVPVDRRWGGARGPPADHRRADRGGRHRLRARGPRGVGARRHRRGDRGDGRRQPDRAHPARLRRDGDRPRAARGRATRPIRLSTVDSLTGLFNRTFFFAALEREIARSARSGRGFCLLMMDLDELKSINDRVGHYHGDRVLRSVGDVILSGVRQIDTAARLRWRRVCRRAAGDRSDRRVRPGREDPARGHAHRDRAPRGVTPGRRCRSAS
jgi:GGDEF domain-containing protein